MPEEPEQATRHLADSSSISAAKSADSNAKSADSNAKSADSNAKSADSIDPAMESVEDKPGDLSEETVIRVVPADTSSDIHRETPRQTTAASACHPECTRYGNCNQVEVKSNN
jgi:hypothetical protein